MSAGVRLGLASECSSAYRRPFSFACSHELQWSAIAAPKPRFRTTSQGPSSYVGRIRIDEDLDVSGRILRQRFESAWGLVQSDAVGHHRGDVDLSRSDEGDSPGVDLAHPPGELDLERP